jgi:putative spermidine/putrescine transport system permease protein
MSDAAGPVLAADGRPLKRSLARALRAQKMRALLLIAPLLIFILITFIAPILDMLFRSVENQIVSETIPRTVVALDDWDASDVPDDDVYAALAVDFYAATERRLHTRLGSRLNYETTGMSSLFRKTGRGVDDIGEIFTDQFVDLNEQFEEPMFWLPLAAETQWLANRPAEGEDRPLSLFRIDPEFEASFPRAAQAYETFARTIQEADGDDPAEEEPWNLVYAGLYYDLMAIHESGAGAEGLGRFDGPVFVEALEAVPGFEAQSYREAFEDIDEDWLDLEVWGTIEAFSDPFTAGYFLSSVDLQLTPQGVEAQPEDQRIYLLLFWRTLFMSGMITISCILLGYPIAYLLSNLPTRSSNLLLILVLLPFWTSLLVRTSAWKVLLQQQGVINDILVWIGLVADDSRLALINNQLGTIIAMTHILLPFMILPMFSVMKTIPPSYVRAAKSLGATNWTAFWRVYFPQSIPGIGAGCILVFILAIGYYITPELVGGRTGTFISNRIAFHISSSLNWGLAAALGSILLAVVLVLYWLYDRIVGIDNVKLG